MDMAVSRESYDLICLHVYETRKCSNCDALQLEAARRRVSRFPL